MKSGTLIWEKPRALDEQKTVESKSSCCRFWKRSSEKKELQSKEKKELQSKEENEIQSKVSASGIHLSISPTPSFDGKHFVYSTAQSEMLPISFNEIVERMDASDSITEFQKGIECFIYSTTNKNSKVILKKGKLRLAIARAQPKLEVRNDEVKHFTVSITNASSTSQNAIKFLEDAKAPLLFDGTPVNKLKHFVVVPIEECVRPLVFVFHSIKEQRLCVKAIALLQTYQECSCVCVERVKS